MKTDYEPTLVLRIDFGGGSYSIGTLAGPYPDRPAIRVYNMIEPLSLKQQDYADMIAEDNANLHDGTSRPRYVGRAWGSCRCLRISEDEAARLRNVSKINDANDQLRQLLEHLDDLTQSLDGHTRDNLVATRKEATALALQWSQIHNEGGDGYVPRIISQEDFDDLTKEIDGQRGRLLARLADL